jgi:small subunit ribosomal protein S6
MRKYEVVCVINPDLDETALNGVLEKVTGWITELGGNVEKVDKWGRRRMAYMIHKHREAQYVLINADLQPSATAELDRNLRLTEPVIRHMITLVG